MIKKPLSSSNEPKPKCCSKESILGSDVILGWSKFIEPNFICYYYYDLPPWPTTKDIEACVQALWDWRFGDTSSLDISESEQHIQLVSKLFSTHLTGVLTLYYYFLS